MKCRGKCHSLKNEVMIGHVSVTGSTVQPLPGSPADQPVHRRTLVEKFGLAPYLAEEADIHELKPIRAEGLGPDKPGCAQS